MNVILDEITMLRAVLVIAMLGVAMSAAEALSQRREYDGGGLFSWQVRRNRVLPHGAGGLTATVDWLFSYPRILVLVAAEFVLALAVVLTAAKVPIVVPAAVLALHLLRRIRNSHYGGEGADQMLILVQLAAIVAISLDTWLSRNAAIWFLTGQVLLAYVTAGLVKVNHPQWRDGTAIRYVLNASGTWGHAWAGRFVSSRPGLCRAVCWSVIVFEILCPLLFLWSKAGVVVLLALGLSFHVGIAVLHGLPLFVIAFASTYPAVWLAAGKIHG